jgi:hypothetical protein
LTRCRLAGLLAWCLISGCRAPANTIQAPAAAGSQVDVVVTFGQGPTERLFALRAPPRISIANAAFAKIPPSGAIRISAYSAADQAGPVLLWIAQTRRIDAVAHISLTTLLVPGRRGAARFAADTTAAATVEQACASEGWIAAFFVDGIGERPTGPVMLNHESGETTLRIEIRPDQHTVPGDLALRVLPRHIGGLTFVDPIGYQEAGASPPALPALARHDYRGWRAEGGSAWIRRHGWTESRSMHGPVYPTDEWRLYLLSLPPACERWYGAQ